MNPLLFPYAAYLHEFWTFYGIAWFAVIPAQLAWWLTRPAGLWDRTRCAAVTLAFLALLVPMARDSFRASRQVHRLVQVEDWVDLEPACRYVREHTAGGERVAINFNLRPEWQFNRTLWHLGRPDLKVSSLAQMQTAVERVSPHYGIFTPAVPIDEAWARHLALNYAVIASPGLNAETGWAKIPFERGGFIADFKQPPSLVCAQLPPDITTVHKSLNRSYELVGYRLPASTLRRKLPGALQRYFTSTNFWYGQYAQPLQVDYYLRIQGRDDAAQDLASFVALQAAPGALPQNTETTTLVVNFLRPARYLPPGTLIHVPCTHLLRHAMPPGEYRLSFGIPRGNIAELATVSLLDE